MDGGRPREGEREIDSLPLAGPDGWVGVGTARGSPCVVRRPCGAHLPAIAGGQPAVHTYCAGSVGLRGWSRACGTETGSSWEKKNGVGVFGGSV
jgi:hypothetical protein